MKAVGIARRGALTFTVIAAVGWSVAHHLQLQARPRVM
jgi:hypothetical protein